MKIAIYGSGAVGGYFGARLAQAGEDVRFFARGAHLRALKTNGLTLTSIKGDLILKKVQVSDNPSEAGIMDVILVGVKAWQVPEAARAIKPMISDHTIVVPLQNGVEAADQLVSELGRSHVLGGFCRILSMVTAPGEILHAGFEPYIAFGELDNSPSTRTQDLLNVFKRAVGVRAEVPPDIHAAIWTKFLFISPYSGIGAITRSTAGEFRSVPETRRLLEAGLNEVYALAIAKGINLPSNIVDKTLAMIDASPADGTSSMQRDIMAGRPSELESQNGAVVRLGHDANVPVPINEFIYASLLPMEIKARN